MASQRITTVFFDLDETLIEHSWIAADLIQSFYDAHPEAMASVDPGDFGAALRSNANAMWEGMFNVRATEEPARVAMFKNTLNAVQADPALAESMANVFEDYMLKTTRPSPGAEHVLDTLRSAGVRVAIITNGFQAMQTRKIAHHGFRDRVDHVIISETVGAHKPDPRIFEYALEKTGGVAEESVHIGDHLANDIAGAIGAGLRAALYDPLGERVADIEQELNGKTPTYVLSRLEDILPIAGI